jgi:protein-disulfide isomerase
MVRNWMRRVAPLTFLGLTVLAGPFAGPVAAQQQQLQQPSPQARLLERAAQSRSKGAETATVLVYEISDFQCPYCRQFAVDVFPQIDSAYIRTNRVRWVFVSLPMPSHMNAWVAAEAALCAGAVSGRFWPLHDRLFEAQSEWATAAQPGPLLARYARESGVTMDAWTTCVEQDRVAPLILQDVIFGSRVSGTPTFVVNNQQTVVGVKTFAEWREILEAALRRRE